MFCDFCETQHKYNDKVYILVTEIYNEAYEGFEETFFAICENCYLEDERVEILNLELYAIGEHKRGHR